MILIKNSVSERKKESPHPKNNVVRPGTELTEYHLEIENKGLEGWSVTHATKTAKSDLLRKSFQAGIAELLCG